MKPITLQIKLTNDPRKRFETKVFSFLRAHQYQRGSTVAYGRRICGCDGTILLEGRPKSWDLFKDNPFVLFILLYNSVALLSFDSDGSDLGIVNTASPSTSSTLVRLDGVSILGLSGDLEFGGSCLSAVPHSKVIVNVPQSVRLQRIPGGKPTERWVLSG